MCFQYIPLFVLCQLKISLFFGFLGNLPVPGQSRTIPPSLAQRRQIGYCFIFPFQLISHCLSGPDIHESTIKLLVFKTMAQTVFEKYGGIYRQQGNYLLPDVTLPNQPQSEIGMRGQSRRRYLKEHHRVLSYSNRIHGQKGPHPVFENRVGVFRFWNVMS